MGYAIAFGPCLLCKQSFGFNPLTVPSFTVNDTREPICSGCMAFLNAKRVERGLPRFPIADDAYEPIEEGAL